MSIHAAKGTLMDAIKQLNARWSHARAQWDDQAAKRLEGEVLDPLGPKVHAAAKGVEELASLFAAARRDCGDDEG